MNRFYSAVGKVVSGGKFFWRVLVVLKCRTQKRWYSIIHFHVLEYRSAT